MSFETLILTLIQIGLVIGACYIVIWALGQFGVAIPPRVIQIFWCIVVLIIILLLYRMLSPSIRGGRLFGFLDFSLGLAA